MKHTSLHTHNYKLERIACPHQVITVKAHWRKLPHVLDGLRSVPYDIRRAHISKNDSILYLKDSAVVNMDDSELERILSLAEADDNGIANRMRLPLDTQMLLYNLPTRSFTTMEFGCHDRIGLLCDLLLFLEPLSVELEEAYVTTVGMFAHNILHLTKNGQQLLEDDLIYIRNVFEYEAKERTDLHHARY